MDKKLMAFICVIVIAVICGAFFLRHFYNPASFNNLAMGTVEPDSAVVSAEGGSGYVLERNVIAGSCAFLLIACTLWFVFRGIKKNNQTDLIATERSPSKLSLAAGSVEYAKRRHDPIDASALQQEEMVPTSFWEWAIALLVISAGLIIPVVIAVFFGFSHFW
jgi:hypothetical protein